MRIRRLMNVTWTMNGEGVSGEGQILNISNSGLLLHIDGRFKPLEQCVLAIDPEISIEERPPFLSKQGVVVWFRKIQTSRYKYLCGLEFFKEPMDQGLQDWIEDKTSQISQTMNASILNNYAI